MGRCVPYSWILGNGLKISIIRVRWYVWIAILMPIHIYILERVFSMWTVLGVILKRQKNTRRISILNINLFQLIKNFLYVTTAIPNITSFATTIHLRRYMKKMWERPAADATQRSW